MTDIRGAQYYQKQMRAHVDTIRPLNARLHIGTLSTFEMSQEDYWDLRQFITAVWSLNDLTLECLKEEPPVKRSLIRKLIKH